MRSEKKTEDANSGAKELIDYGVEWAKWSFEASLLLAELLILGFRLIITGTEALYRTFLPPVEKSLKNEVILITGTGHGIGRELVLQLASHGCILVCWDIDEEGNQETVKLLSNKGYKKNVYAYTCDVSKRDDVSTVAERVKKEVGDVTMLINNAGIMPCRPLASHTSQEIQRIFDVNVLAHFWTLEAFLPSMVQNNHGHIVALSSMCGVVGIPNVVPYCSSKFAVRGLMESLHEELRAGTNSISNTGLPNPKSQVKFTTVYPIMVGTGLVKKPRNRFPALLSLLSADQVARQIIKGIRRNYKELSIPAPMLTLDRIARLLPGKFTQHAMDFAGTGVDPDD